MSYNAMVRERGGEDHPVEAYRAMPDHRAAALDLWIRLALSPRKTVKRFVTSYGLKHQAEDDIGTYISNAQFKGAMLAQGYEPADGIDLNWEFKIKPREGRRLDTESGFGLDRERLDGSLVVLFDAIASWSRINEKFDYRNRQALLGESPSTGPIATERDAQAFERADELIPGLIPGRVLEAAREGARRNVGDVRPGRRVG
jgi:hypothetical protein